MSAHGNAVATARIGMAEAMKEVAKNMSPVASTRPPTEVQAEVKRLGHVMEQLLAEGTALEEDLAPVLRVRTPSCEGEKKDRPGCSLAQVLGDLADEAEITLAGIQSIRERLEL